MELVRQNRAFIPEQRKSSEIVSTSAEKIPFDKLPVVVYASHVQHLIENEQKLGVPKGDADKLADKLMKDFLTAEPEQGKVLTQKMRKLARATTIAAEQVINYTQLPDKNQLRLF